MKEKLEQLKSQINDLIKAEQEYCLKFIESKKNKQKLLKEYNKIASKEKKEQIAFLPSSECCFSCKKHYRNEQEVLADYLKESENKQINYVDWLKNKLVDDNVETEVVVLIHELYNAQSFKIINEMLDKNYYITKVIQMPDVNRAKIYYEKSWKP